MNSEDRSIGVLAARGVFWSVVQNWGGKLFTLVLFVVLARFLSPTDYGMAAAAGLVLLLIQMLAEFGFGDAIVQRPDLRPQDVNLPFYASVGASIILVAVVAALSGTIETFFNVEGLTPVLIAICAAMPINTISLFQEIQYRRHLEFKPLALRTFVANLVGGVGAVACAVGGLGVWSIVVQTYVATFISLIWLWRKPLWRPSLAIDVTSFVKLLKFGISTVGLRLVDFAATRLVEVIIVGRYGLAIYGVYTVGSRLYQTLMQLLQSALYDVSLTVLSKISSDRERLAEIYLRSITIFSHLASPIFMLVAAVAPEVCHVLFGSKWQGVEHVTQPLLLLGALQCVQFLNGPYLSARGRPNFVFYAGLAKAVATITGLSFIQTDDIVQLTLVFIAGQLAATPLTFGFTLWELRIPITRFLATFLPAYCFTGVAFACVLLVRYRMEAAIETDFLKGTILGAVFTLVYCVQMLIFRRPMIQMFVSLVSERIKRRRHAHTD